MKIAITSASIVAFAFAFAPSFANAANINTALHSVGHQIQQSAHEDLKASSADYHLLKRSNEENLKRLGDGLESLTYDMMYAIGPMGFMYNDFDNNAVDYATKLLDLELAVKQVSPPDASLSKKLEYTKRVSREMTEAVLLDKIFRKAGVKEYDILKTTIETDLSILRFLNTSGEPNTVNGEWFLHGGRARANNAEFATWLASFRTEVENLVMNFASMEVPLNVVRFFFEDRVRTISRKLQELSDFYDTKVGHPELPQ